MANNTVTTASAALKLVYRDQKVEDVTLNNNPLLAWLPKDESAGGGDGYPLPIMYAAGQGRAATFSHAQGNATAIKTSKFTLTRINDYQVDRFSGELLDAAEDDMESFVNVRTQWIDKGLSNLAANMAIMLYGNGGGARGRVGSVSTVTLTLLTTADIKNFEVGMSLVSCDTDGTSGSVDTDVSVVLTIDRTLGTMTEAGTWTTGSVFQNNDYIFCEGDFGVQVSGLAAWLPSSAPGATSFFGVDRTADSRLGGLRYDGSGMPIEEAFQKGEELGFTNGARINTIFCSPPTFTSVKISLGSKVEYTKMLARNASGEVASIGFEGLKMHGASGKPVTIIADPRCPDTVAYALQQNTWHLISKGKAPHILDKDGLVIRAVSDDDAYEIRMGSRYQLGCSAPSHNVRIALA